jgi:hypothetical protein
MHLGDRLHRRGFLLEGGVRRGEVATREDLEEKNRLCPSNPYPDAAIDWLTSNSISWRAQAAWNSDPDLGAWLESSRLNASRAIAEHVAEPQMQSALARYFEYSEPAIENIDRLTV